MKSDVRTWEGSVMRSILAISDKPSYIVPTYRLPAWRKGAPFVALACVFLFHFVKKQNKATNAAKATDKKRLPAAARKTNKWRRAATKAPSSHIIIMLNNQCWNPHRHHPEQTIVGKRRERGKTTICNENKRPMKKKKKTKAAAGKRK